MDNNQGLSESETKTLFNEMSAAVTSNDSAKIAELVKPTETKESTTTTPETPEATKVVEVVTDVGGEKKSEKQEEVSTSSTTDSTASTTEEKESHKTAADPLAWINSLPEEHQERARALAEENRLQRTKTRQAQQQYRSNAGRIAAHQRTITTLQTQLRAKPLTEDIAAKLAKIEDFDALAESDPKFANLLKARDSEIIEGLSSAFQKKLESIVNPLIKSQEEQAEHETTQFVEEQREIIRQNVPNFEEVVKHPLFSKWAQEEATDLQRKQVESPWAEDGLQALQTYHMWLMKAGHIKPEPVVNTPAVTTPTHHDTSKADQVAAAREKKSPVSSTVAASTTPAMSVSKTSDIVDPQALFDKFFAEELKKLQRS